MIQPSYEPSCEKIKLWIGYSVFLLFCYYLLQLNLKFPPVSFFGKLLKILITSKTVGRKSERLNEAENFLR
jgi:hypothetical protein